MSINWFAGGRFYDVGYDGDVIAANIAVDQWQPPEAFEKALDEALAAARARMVAKQKELHANA